MFNEILLSSLKPRVCIPPGLQEKRWDTLGFSGSIEAQTARKIGITREKISEEFRGKFFPVLLPRDILLLSVQDLLNTVVRCLGEQGFELTGLNNLQRSFAESQWNEEFQKVITSQEGNFLCCLMDFGHSQPLQQSGKNERELPGIPTPLEVVLLALCVQTLSSFFSCCREWLIASSETTIIHPHKKDEKIPLCLLYEAWSIGIQPIDWVEFLRPRAKECGGFVRTIFIY